ncbi:MAG: hypothetical protein WDN31_06720 [Hyphomicrobium sp.]
MPAIAGDYSICLTASDSLGCMIEQAEFSRQRNAEIDASIARVERSRQRELALSLTHCKSRYSRAPALPSPSALSASPRPRTTLINASMTRVAEVRAFETARRAEADASIAAVEARRTRELEIRQNALIEASIAAAEAQRPAPLRRPPERARHRLHRARGRRSPSPACMAALAVRV